MSTETSACDPPRWGRIVPGADVWQDFQHYVWPQCQPPKSEYEGEEYKHLAKNPNMLFLIRRQGTYWVCTAPGYGDFSTKGAYGSGSIYVPHYLGVTFPDTKNLERETRDVRIWMLALERAARKVEDLAVRMDLYEHQPTYPNLRDLAQALRRIPFPFPEELTTDCESEHAKCNASSPG